MRLEALQGHWALVTGASSGIGREFAVQLAAAGVNLVLVARRAERLRILAVELSETHGIDAFALPADLAQPGIAERLHRRLREEEICPKLLVNNAALGRWAPFEKSPADFYEEMIRVNAVAPVSLCREFMPDLASSGRGVIINVSSPAAYQPVPYMAVYAATKALLHHFSLALHEEWRGKGVWVQTFLPGPTPTKLEGAQAGIKGGSSATEMVRTSLARLGHPLVIGARGTFLQRLFVLLPTRFVLGRVGTMFRPQKNCT
ncbi:SDR family NAD(P)-dependent oxidoreductase [Methylohalobius crimeensis]|uniref:SDR family NAD(P)-dependent oxidoreductase n=1 Tax=Methylohalobius crimeensis TaxID=244365 RepID=UPI0003B4B39D|nr:SDR family NAD(P)-dependent oxidoreductase [Methylohalobius crimeensis]